MYLFELPTLNLLLALGGILLLIVTVGLYLDYFVHQSSYYSRWFAKYAWPAMIITTTGGIAVALLYSEYYGFVPCSLCWLQRIALFPQAILALMALRLKDSLYFPLYGIALSIFGLIVSLYHYAYQLLPKEASGGMVLPCLADGSGDCAVKVINQFGFITFPFLTAVLFAFLIIVYLNVRRHR